MLYVLVYLVPGHVSALPFGPTHESWLEGAAANRPSRADRDCAHRPAAGIVDSHRGGIAVSVAPLLRKVFLVDLLKGMSVTFNNQSEKERITEQYPLERPVIFERYRGQPRLNSNPDTGESLCIVC